MLELTKEEICYLAGILDGEGTVSILHTSGRFVLLVRVSNTDKDLMDWITERLETSAYHLRAKEHHKDVYTLELVGRRAQEFLKIVEPYLIVKKIRAQLALEFPLLHRGDKCTQELKLKQAVLYIQMKDLNRKGTLSQDRDNDDDK